MSKKGKRLERFLAVPSDYKLEELISFLNDVGYKVENRGRTSGSAICFFNSKTMKKIIIHRPHPGNIIKKYCIRIIKEHLEQEGLLNEIHEI